MENKKQLLLGIDLGTSRSAVMSSTGAKAMTASVVGYPKDLIGVKLLGGTSVIGYEALRHQNYLNLHYPLEDGVLKESEDHNIALDLIKYLIAQTNSGEFDEACGIIGVPARASMTNKNRLLEMVSDILDVAMVVSEPFMVAYGQDKLLDAMVIDIGAGTTDICILRGQMPGADDQATLLKAGNFVDEKLKTLIAHRYSNVYITPAIAQQIKERYSFVGEPTSPVIVTLREQGKPQNYDITEQVRAACESMVPDIIDRLKHLLPRFVPEALGRAVNNIYLVGGGASVRGLDKMIAAQLAEFGDVKINLVPDPAYAGCIGGLKLARDLPTSYWSQLGDMLGSSGLKGG